MTVLFLVHASEGLEKMWQRFSLDAHSGIGNAYVQKGISALKVFALHVKADGALLGVLDRVVQKVDQNLFDPDLVAVKS